MHWECTSLDQGSGQVWAWAGNLSSSSLLLR